MYITSGHDNNINNNNSDGNVVNNGNTMPAPLPFTQMDAQIEFMAVMQLTAISQYDNSWPPQTHVAPADMSLPPPAAGPIAPSAISGGAHRPARAHGRADSGPGLESFARLEFADSVFQMTTYAVTIGRDQRALNQARVDERRRQDYERLVEDHAAKGLPPPTPPSQKQGKFSKSYVSEEGGMLGPESDGDDNPRPAKRRRTSGGGGGGGSGARLHHRREELGGEEAPAETGTAQNLENNRQYLTHTPGAAMVDVASLRPSPHHVPFLGIHSPGPDIATKTKAISRQHLRIAYNQKTSVFEAIPLHKNGFFRDDTHYRDEPVVLRSGDRLQVKDVSFTFVINGVKHGMTGAEDECEEEESSSRRYSEGGKELSFEFESSHAEDMMDSCEEEVEQLVEVVYQSDPELSADEAGDEDEEEEEEEEDEDEEAAEEEDEDEIMETVESDEPEPEPKPAPELPPPPPKTRGPGRPPKNGLMSKREERLRKKMALEEAKKAMPPPPPGEPPVKRKVGRPRKHPIDENGERPE